MSEKEPERTEIVRTDWSDPSFQELVKELDTFLAVLDGHESERFRSFNRAETMTSVVVAKRDGRPVGCGALRALDSETVEIKRMYVRPTARGLGIGTRVLRELESWAREARYNRIVLETAVELRPAQELYEREGFVRIPNYGQYKCVERSLCYGKDVA